MCLYIICPPSTLHPPSDRLAPKSPPWCITQGSHFPSSTTLAGRTNERERGGEGSCLLTQKQRYTRSVAYVGREREEEEEEEEERLKWEALLATGDDNICTQEEEEEAMAAAKGMWMRRGVPQAIGTHTHARTQHSLSLSFLPSMAARLCRVCRCL